MKLYKFRSLGDRESCQRAGQILTNGEFWCSSLWEQNDPMEGVYTFHPQDIDVEDRIDVFTQKNEYRICSFSGGSALRDPTMWGYYANGFKGLAIEIEIPVSDVTKVKYRNGPQHWLRKESEDIDIEIRRIITTKLMRWNRENEYRYLVKGPSAAHEIGEITGVYFGDPYANVSNMHVIQQNSPSIREYVNNKELLLQHAKDHGYPCYSASINKLGDEWTVVSSLLDE